MTLPDRILQQRKQQGLTQEELADKAKVTVRTIQRIESGEVSPRAYTLKAIAGALNAPLELFVTPAPDGEPVDSKEEAGPTGGEAGKHGRYSGQAAMDEEDRHFLQLLTLSALAYLVLPFLNIMVPAQLLKRYGRGNALITGAGRKIIRQQVYWTVALHLLLGLTLAFNLLQVSYFHDAGQLSYFLPLAFLYLLNATLILRAAFSITRQGKRMSGNCRVNAVS